MARPLTASGRFVEATDSLLDYRPDAKTVEFGSDETGERYQEFTTTTAVALDIMEHAFAGYFEGTDIKYIRVRPADMAAALRN